MNYQKLSLVPGLYFVGVPIGTVMSRLSAARKKLRELLEGVL